MQVGAELRVLLVRPRHRGLDRRCASSRSSTQGPIRVGDDVWFGVGAIVLSGVTIGDGAVIGAGAVVTSDVPENAVAVGVPARVIRLRGQ